MVDLTGKLIGKVRVERLIGRGGMAEVYLGRHTTLDRPVAVKVLQRLVEPGAAAMERFQREARVVAGLRHPNIVTIYDFDLSDGQPFIVMEYVDGPSLAAHLSALHATGGRMPIALLARLISRIAAALDYAHQQGVVHRDIKPGNILLASRAGPLRAGDPLPADVEPILTDFGLVRLLDAGTQASSGSITGTPAYMSPEQARGNRVDGRSDVYSLGVVLYEMLAGHVPFESESLMATLVKHLNEAPAPIPDLPAGLQAVVMRALEKDPRQRYQTAGELANALLTALGLAVEEARQTPVPFATPDQPTLPPGSTPVTPSSLPPPTHEGGRRFRWLWIVPAALGLGFLLTRLLPAQQTSVPTPEPTHAMDSVPVTTVESFGQLRFHDVAARLDEVTLTSFRMAPPPPGFAYEAWLVAGEERRSLGRLNVDAEGRGELNFIDPQGRNLLARFDKLEITLEPDPDSSPNPSGRVAYSSGLPPMALTHIRHLLTGFGGAPNQTPLIFGLIDHAALVDEYARRMLAAYQAGDAAGVSSAAEVIHNLLVGAQSPQHGDLNSDGRVDDPGDGYGLLLNGDQSGYILGSYSHAQFAASMDDATENIQTHALHVMAATKNVEDWATELRDLVTQLAADPLAAANAERVRAAAALADRMYRGRDLNGNERIEAIPGEGGAQTAADHAYYLADMPILSGANQMPPPGPPFNLLEGLEEYHTP